jgi:hypothetical protein
MNKHRQPSLGLSPLSSQWRRPLPLPLTRIASHPYRACQPAPSHPEDGDSTTYTLHSHALCCIPPRLAGTCRVCPLLAVPIPVCLTALRWTWRPPPVSPATHSAPCLRPFFPSLSSPAVPRPVCLGAGTVIAQYPYGAAGSNQSGQGPISTKYDVKCVTCSSRRVGESHHTSWSVSLLRNAGVHMQCRRGSGLCKGRRCGRRPRVRSLSLPSTSGRLRDPVLGDHPRVTAAALSAAWLMPFRGSEGCVT